jgi:Flagellar motor switch protein
MPRRPPTPAEIAAELLGNLPASQQASALETLKQHDPKLAEQVEGSLFTFDQLADLDKHSLQTLLREIAPEDLATALHGAPQALLDKAFANLSRRVAEQMKEDMEGSRTTAAEMDTVRRQILKRARQLAAEGKISLGGEEEWVE